MDLSLKAPAKVNLYLRITGKRDDGYHSLISLVQMVSLYDTIRIRSLKVKKYYTVCGNFSVPKNKNTIWKALDIFKKKTGINIGISIRVRKQIPIGAGLGGGSSDAAAVLMGLDTLFETKLGNGQLAEMALHIGSDVPFFLGTTAAVVSGRGEKIVPVPPRSDFSIVAVYPGLSVNTSQAYLWYDEYLPHTELNANEYSADDVSQMYQNQNVREWRFDNSFNRIIERHHPIVCKLSRILVERGAVFSGVSGSGSVVMGIFEDSVVARNVAENLKRRNFPFAELLKPLVTV